MRIAAFFDPICAFFQSEPTDALSPFLNRTGTVAREIGRKSESVGRHPRRRRRIAVDRFHTMNTPPAGLAKEIAGFYVLRYLVLKAIFVCGFEVAP